MTNYNDGKWHPIPSRKPDSVHDKTEVEMIWRLREDGSIKAETRPASGFAWPDGDVTENIAFRVVKEYREPREFWITLYDGMAWEASAQAEQQNANLHDGGSQIIHVREVLE